MRNKRLLYCLIMALFALVLCSCDSNATNEMTESEISETTEDSKEDIIQKTKDSLKVYTDYIGIETENGNLAVTDEFLENVESVFIMGRTGSVNHGMTGSSDTQIRIMEWNDSVTSTEDEFENFIVLLNEYWGENGLIGNYDNMSDETYVWKDYEHSSWVACWFKDGLIRIQWEYDEEIPSSKEVEELNELMQPIDGSEDSSIDNSIIEKVLEDNQRIPPQIGMTTEEVRQSTWGEPSDINKTTYAWGTKEQWCYSGYRYIYFEDGIVTAIQE